MRNTLRMQQLGTYLFLIFREICKFILASLTNSFMWELINFDYSIYQYLNLMDFKELSLVSKSLANQYYYFDCYLNFLISWDSSYNNFAFDEDTLAFAYQICSVYLLTKAYKLVELQVLHSCTKITNFFSFDVNLTIIVLHVIIFKSFQWFLQVVFQ